jgi:hypothetical protein
VGPLALGRYRLQHRLGVGAVGSVFEAIDERSGRDVVVKLFDGVVDGYRDWLDELRLALRFEHRHIVRCLDGGQDAVSGAMTLVFERAWGGSARRHLVERGAFDDDATWVLIDQVAQALAQAHAVGVMHRDVKPENVVWSPPAGWQVTDFGAGRFTRGRVSVGSSVVNLEYLAPECLVPGSEVDFSVDQFALGMVAFEARFGRRARADERAAFCLAHRDGVGLEAVVARMLAGHPRGRFPDLQSVALVAQARSLAQFEQRPAADARPWRLGDRLAGGARLPGVHTFVHSQDAQTPALLVRGRVVSPSDLRHVIVMCGADQVLSVRAELDESWLQQETRLCLVVKGRSVASAEGPSLANAELTLQPEAGTLLAAARGTRVVTRVRRVGARLEALEHPTPGPIEALGYVDGALAAIGGDARDSWVQPLDGAACRRVALSVEQLAVGYRPAGAS